jgi:hypothetical protein
MSASSPNATRNPPRSNKLAALRHVELVTGAPDTEVYLRFLDDTKTGRPAAERYGTIENMWPVILDFQRQHYGVFLIPNATEAAGAFVCDSDVKIVRAAFIDADGVAEPNEWHVLPAFLVRTSPGKWHAYWIATGIAVAEFQQLQRRLAAHYATDAAICNPSRVMRLAGTIHWKDPEHPHLVTLEDRTQGSGHWEITRTLDVLSAGLPQVKGRRPSQRAERLAVLLVVGKENVEPRTTTRADVDFDEPQNIWQARSYLAAEVRAGRVAIEHVNGNATLHRIAAQLRDYLVSEEKAKELIWSDFNEHCEPEWDDPADPTFNEPIESAYRGNVQNPAPGRDAVLPLEKRFAGFERIKGAEDGGTAQDEKSENDWPEPFDLLDENEITPEPVLMRDMLPDTVAIAAFDEAERIGVSPAAVALPMLAVVGSVLHPKVTIQPKVHDHTWTERAILWPVNVAPVGSAKSPAQAAAVAPLYKLDREFHQQAEQQQRFYEALLADWKEKAKHRSLMMKKSALEHISVIDASPELEPDKPKRRRAFVNDVTLEKLAEVLAENGRPVMQVVDEIAGLIGGFDAYRKNGGPSKDRAAYLELYEGRARTWDRIGRGSIHVEHWATAISGNIQPEKLAELAPLLITDGLLQRAMLFYTERQRGEDRLPNKAALDAYEKIVVGLAAYEPSMASAIELSEDAQVERLRVKKVSDAMMALPSTPVALRGHLAKWDGLFARLLLVFHVAACSEIGLDPQPVIEGDTAAAVRRLMLRFLLPMAIRIYRRYFGKGERLGHAQWIAGHILAHGLPDIAASQIKKAYRAARPDPRIICEAMADLHDARWVRPAPVAADRWEINPKVHARFAATAAEEKRKREAVQAAIREAAGAMREEFTEARWRHFPLRA